MAHEPRGLRATGQVKTVSLTGIVTSPDCDFGGSAPLPRSQGLVAPAFATTRGTGLVNSPQARQN